MKSKSVIATRLLALLGFAACAQTTDAGFSVAVRHFVAPTYPVAAWLARIQGTVVTEVIIEPDGKADSVKFISADPMFREPVETALRQWSFHPNHRLWRGSIQTGSGCPRGTNGLCA
jgi:TonB family protein